MKQLGNTIVLALLGLGVVVSLVVAFGARNIATSNKEEVTRKAGVVNENIGFKSLDKDKYQAVFLRSNEENTASGGVYFGKVTEVNGSEIELTDIYYLRNGSINSTSEDISLAKLGCELHGPEDKMAISRAEIAFWENLKEDGQVVQAITAFKEANPRGQSCTTQ